MAKGTHKGGWTLAVWLGILAGSVCAAGETSASSPRVRSSDPALVALIDQATHRSKTFRQLVQTIEATNGIVYVDPGKCSHGVHACLPMSMQVSGPNRLMHIVIDRTTRASDIETMTSLGHELQHAIEVLGDPTVYDGLTMFNFYRRTATTDSNRVCPSASRCCSPGTRRVRYSSATTS